MKRIIPVAAATVLALSACGSSGISEQTDETVAVETTPPEPLTQEEWVEMCAPDSGSDQENPRCFEDMDAEYDDDLGEWDGIQGDWVMFREMDADDELHDWSIRVDDAELTSLIPDGADNPEYMGGDLDAPDRIDAEPESGSEFLVVNFTARNDSVQPRMLPADYAVHFSDGEVFWPTSDDEFISQNLMNDLEKSVDSEHQNPGKEAGGVAVFSVPEGSEVVAFELMDAYMMSGFYATIELTDISRQ